MMTLFVGDFDGEAFAKEKDTTGLRAFHMLRLEEISGIIEKRVLATHGEAPHSVRDAVCDALSEFHKRLADQLTQAEIEQLDAINSEYYNSVEAALAAGELYDDPDGGKEIRLVLEQSRFVAASLRTTLESAFAILEVQNCKREWSQQSSGEQVDEDPFGQDVALGLPQADWESGDDVNEWKKDGYEEEPTPYDLRDKTDD